MSDDKAKRDAMNRDLLQVGDDLADMAYLASGDRSIDPSVCIVNVEDYPDVNWQTDDGKEEFSRIGFNIAWRDSSKWHIVFCCGGEEVGEIIVRRGFDDHDMQ